MPFGDNLLAGHSRGIFLMRKSMDEVDSEFDQGTGGGLSTEADFGTVQLPGGKAEGEIITIRNRMNNRRP